jgi:hypothetical protein
VNGFHSFVVLYCLFGLLTTFPDNQIFSTIPHDRQKIFFDELISDKEDGQSDGSCSNFEQLPSMALFSELSCAEDEVDGQLVQALILQTFGTHRRTVESLGFQGRSFL